MGKPSLEINTKVSFGDCTVMQKHSLALVNLKLPRSYSTRHLITCRAEPRLTPKWSLNNAINLTATNPVLQPGQATAKTVKEKQILFLEEGTEGVKFTKAMKRDINPAVSSQHLQFERHGKKINVSWTSSSSSFWCERNNCWLQSVDKWRSS